MSAPLAAVSSDIRTMREAVRRMGGAKGFQYAQILIGKCGETDFAPISTGGSSFRRRVVTKDHCLRDEGTASLACHVRG